MATRYERIERTGSLNTTQVATPRNVDFAGLRESQRMSQMVSQAAERVTQFAFKKAEAQARWQGKRAGAANPQKTLSASMTDRPDTVYEQAAYDAAVDVSAATIGVEARQDVAAALFNAERDQVDPTQLRAELTDITEGYADSLRIMDPVKAAQMRAQIQAVSETAFIQYSDTFLALETERLGADWQGLETTVRQTVEAAARRGAPGWKSQYIDPYIQDGETLRVRAGAIETTQNRLLEAGYIAALRGRFDRAHQKGEGADFLAQFDEDLRNREVIQIGEARVVKAGQAAGLSESAIKVLQAEMRAVLQRDVRSNAQAHARAVASAKADIIDQQRIVDRGHQVEPEAVTLLGETVEPLNNPDLNKRLQVLRDTSAVVAKMSDYLPEDAEEFYNSLRKGFGEEVTPLQSQILEAAKRSLSNITQAFASDPVRALDEAGHAALPGISLADIAAGNDAAQKRFERMADWSRRLGIAFAPLRKDEQAELSAYIMDPDQNIGPVVQLVHGLVGLAGPNRAEKMLHGFGMNPANSAVWVHSAVNFARTGDPEFFQHTIRGVQAFRHGPLPEGDPADQGAMQQVIVKYAAILSPTDLGSYSQTAKMATAGRRLSNTDNLYVEDFENSYEALMGRTGEGDNASGGTYEYNDNEAHLIWLPPGMLVKKMEALEKAFEKGDAIALRHLIREAIRPDGSGEDWDGGKLFVAGKAGPEPVSDTDYENLTFDSNKLRPGLVYVKNSQGHLLIEEQGAPVILDLLRLEAAYDIWRLNPTSQSLKVRENND